MSVPRLLFPLALALIANRFADATEVVTPLEGSTRYEISNLRTETGQNGSLTLAFDYKQTQEGEFATHFIKGKSAHGFLSIAATMPLYSPSGTVRLTSFGPPGSNPKLDLELYVVQMLTIGESKYLYAMVSNPIRIGDPGAATQPRPWTAEERSQYEEYQRNKPLTIKRYEITTAIPDSAVAVPNTAKLTAGTKLQACYQSKWWPITTLEENNDGSVRVRWDDWGEKFDCNMLRSELIVAKTVLSRLDRHPATRFPETPSEPSGAAPAATASPPKPLKSYPVTIAVPSDSEFVPADVELPAGVPLQACYAGKWNPITHLSHNPDGTLTIRWDDYGPSFDCSMRRDELIIKKTKLKELSGSSPTRTWTDSTGRFKVEAKLLRSDATNVTLLTEGGKEVTLPLAKLSQADRDFLNTQAVPSENPFE